MHEWLESAQERIAGASGLDPSELALSSDRKNAPLVCFLAGVALGRKPELDLAELAREAATERP